MGELPGLVAGGGVLAALVAVIGYLLAGNRADRRQYEEAIDRAEARADAAEQRTRDARAVAEEARKGRWAAEEKVAQLRVELRRYTGTPPP